jgi:7,8-dihydropterin-6-yl-methyl-4-(beta-D-ribofuranosyl)aminobenzene 5'-phosphate synthase
MSYYRGEKPDVFGTGSPWPDANFEIITKPTEIFDGLVVFPTQSDKPGTREMNELSLAIKTPEGLAVVVGCSHPGIEKILENATAIDSRIYTVAGGLHLVVTPPAEVQRVADALYDKLKVKRIAPGHCTSEIGFKLLMHRFGNRFDEAGVGQTIALP